MKASSTVAWPRVARVLSGYWFRRHRTAVAAVAGAGLVALTLVLLGQRDRAELLFAQILLFAPIAAGLLTASGIVSDERESCLIIMWFQKPGSLLRTYIARYAIGQSILFVLCTIFALAVATATAVAGIIPLDRAIRIVSVLWMFAFLPAAIVFALSAWGVRRDALIALLLIITSVMAGVGATFQEGAFASLLRHIAFPVDPITVLIGSSQHLPLRTALLIVLTHCVAWSLFGLAGLRYTGHALSRGR